jgi:2-keto-3-deoxy-L-rhamnonate aldolase RhmA
MRPNRTKEKLRQGQRVVGTWVMLGDPAIVELAGIAGLDFVIIDMEHTARELSTIEHMVRAAEVVDVTPIVRVSENNEKLILRVLETGVQGVVVPQLETAEDAARAVASVRYPLDGARGVCSLTRAARYGALRPTFADYVDDANDEILLIGLIETAAGVENVGAILDAGVELAYVGRRDLSGSLGVHGHVEHPAVLEAQAAILAAVAERPGRFAGLVPYLDAQTGTWVTSGAQLLTYRTDLSLILEGLEQGARMLRAEAEMVA